MMFVFSSASQLFVQSVDLWLPTIMLLLVLNVVVIGIMYAVSKLLGSRRLEAKVTSELFQFIASVMILLLLLSFKSVGDVTINGLYLNDFLGKSLGEVVDKEGTINVFDVNYVYLVKISYIIKKELYDLNDYISSHEYITRIYASVSYSKVSVPIPTQLESIWFDVYKKYLLAEQYFWLEVIDYFMIHLLRWVESSMLSFYLPLGLVLRMFSPTRAGGATIIAFALSLYFVFPFILAVLYLTGPSLEGLSVDSASGSSTGAKVCPLDPFAVEELYKSYSVGESTLSLSVNPRNYNLVRLFGFYYPLIAFVTSLMVAKSIANILGGDLGGIGRSILRVV